MSVEEDIDLDEVYDAEFLLEMIEYGMVEGGYMPDAFDGPEPPTSLLVEQTRKAIRCHTDEPDASDQPEWVQKLLLTILEDEPFLLAMCFEVFSNGWMSGRYSFHGRELECCREHFQKSPSDRMTDYVTRFHPALKA